MGGIRGIRGERKRDREKRVVKGKSRERGTLPIVRGESTKGRSRERGDDLLYKLSLPERIDQKKWRRESIYNRIYIYRLFYNGIAKIAVRRKVCEESGRSGD